MASKQLKTTSSGRLTFALHTFSHAALGDPRFGAELARQDCCIPLYCAKHTCEPASQWEKNPHAILGSSNSVDTGQLLECMRYCHSSLAVQLVV